MASAAGAGDLSFVLPPILVGAAGAGESEPAVGDGGGVAFVDTLFEGQQAEQLLRRLPPYFFSRGGIKYEGLDLLEGLVSPPVWPQVPDNSSDDDSTSSQESSRGRLGGLKPTGRRGRGSRRRTKFNNSYYY